MNHIKTDPSTGRKRCGCFKRCGGCQLDESYPDQLQRKNAKASRLLSSFGPVQPIVPMDVPYNYRAKVQTVYGFDRSGRVISGVYQSSGRRFTATDDCMLEDKRAQTVVRELKKLIKPLKLYPFDTQTGKGILRHTLIRTSPSTDQLMLVIVTSGPRLPAKNSLVTALREKCPFITTIVQNICTDPMPLTLGERENVLWGKGYIEDELCGCRFRISPRSFYQVNPAQTGKLYEVAVTAAGAGKGVTVIDAYCGTGTIGIICASRGAMVIGAESNEAACRDAAANARLNGVEDITFYARDAGEFLDEMARRGQRCDVLIMDPPRAGASLRFIRSIGRMRPGRVVYVSCKIETLKRDLDQLTKLGYRAESIRPFDMFPHTTSIETVISLVLDSSETHPPRRKSHE